MTTDDRIAIALIDPNDISRSGCKAIFESDPRFTSVAAVAFPEALSAHSRQDGFDVVVLDPVLDGEVDYSQVYATLSALPSARVLVLTESIDPSFYAEALRAGARGLLVKGQTPGWLLLNAAHIIATSSAVIIDKGVLLRMRLAGVAWTPAETKGSLSRRENEVVQLLSEGMSDDEVARSLGIARATVHTHVSSIMRKLPASNRVQLGIYLQNAGLIQGPRVQEPAKKAS